MRNDGCDSCRELVVPVNIVAKKIYIDELNDILAGYSVSKKVNIIFKDAPTQYRHKTFKIFKTRRNSCSAYRSGCSCSWVFVDFLGDEAWTPSGLVVMALKTGVEVLVGIDCRVVRKF
ncbi:MAG: hypothetical protein LE168_03360 [Endomicrobium sp.]|nr:hypothetical protein [Endomicrobium sp.]